MVCKWCRDHFSTSESANLYVGISHPALATNTNFIIIFLLTQLLEALYEDLPVQSIEFEVYHHFLASVSWWKSVSGERLKPLFLAIFIIVIIIIIIIIINFFGRVSRLILHFLWINHKERWFLADSAMKLRAEKWKKTSNLMLYTGRSSEPPEVGLVVEVCIGGWSWVCHLYTESATLSLINCSRTMTAFLL